MYMYNDERLILIEQNVQPQDIDNYLRWLRLYPDWTQKTKSEKKKIKRMHNKQFVEAVIENCKRAIANFPTQDNTFVTYTPNKEEETMNYAYAVAAPALAPANLDTKKIDYLLNRLSMLQDKKYRDLRDHFGFYHDREPSNPKELVEKIKAGEFSFTKFDIDGEELEEDDRGEYGHPFYGIRWGKPGAKPDKKGFEAAEEKLNVAWQTAKDGIIISSPDEGLKILREFESATFH